MDRGTSGGGRLDKGEQSFTTPPPPKGSAFSTRRADAFRLRAGHRGLVHEAHRSLALCGLGRRPFDGSPEELQRSSLVCQPATEEAHARADIRGAYRCASAAACPVCAPKVAAARAAILEPQVEALVAQGYRAFLVTFTMRHTRDDRLSVLYGGLGRAWARLTSGKGWKALTASGPVQYVRGYDLTFSEANGWHPHIHVTLLVPPSYEDPRAFAEGFKARWLASLEAVGFEGTEAAQDVQECRSAAQATRYAVTPAAVIKEVLGTSTKTKRHPRAGMTAFDVLRAAVEEDAEEDRWKARWVEYVEGVKGRRQTTTSRGLSLKDDAELLEESQGLEVAEIGNEALRELDRRNLLAPLLDAVEGASHVGLDAMRKVAWALLGNLAARDWEISTRRPGEPPPDLTGGLVPTPPSGRAPKHWRMVPPSPEAQLTPW